MGARKTLTRPSPRGDLCVTRAWLPGRPLTDFRRGRRNLPLPSERLKTGVPLNRLTPNTVASPRSGEKVTARSRPREFCDDLPGEGLRGDRSSDGQGGIAQVSLDGCRRPGFGRSPIPRSVLTAPRRVAYTLGRRSSGSPRVRDKGLTRPRNLTASRHHSFRPDHADSRPLERSAYVPS